MIFSPVHPFIPPKHFCKARNATGRCLVHGLSGEASHWEVEESAQEFPVNSALSYEKGFLGWGLFVGVLWQIC